MIRSKTPSKKHGEHHLIVQSKLNKCLLKLHFFLKMAQEKLKQIADILINNWRADRAHFISIR